MTGGRRRLLEGSRAPMLVGWLFADLLLVLFITAVASLPPVANKAQATRVKTVHHHHPPPKPRVLERKPQTIRVNVPPAEISNPTTHHEAVKRLLKDLQRQLAADGLQGRQAGFVVVLAQGPLSGIGQAISTAKHVLGVVRAKEPGFSQISGLAYWMGSGNLEFKIFFFA